MTRTRSARGPRIEGPLLRRLLGTLAALFHPQALLSFPLLRLLARRRDANGRRLAAGSQAEHAAGAIEWPAALPAANVVRDPGPMAGVAVPAPRAAPPARRATRRSELYTVVRVDPDFGPRSYARTFAALQDSRSPKLLDLTWARGLDADVFEHLAGAWTVSSDAVPRLGVLLAFERWVMLAPAALVALSPLAARGVAIGVFYEEQALGGRLAAWFAHGQVLHNVRAVVATLAARWRPSPSWPTVLDALGRMARSFAAPADLPALLTEIAGLALSCGGAEQATTFAREALYYLPEDASATRCKALRELGIALMTQGQSVAGLSLLDQAITMAAVVRDPVIGASALCQSGLYALNHADYPGAERRFREAIVVLSPQASGAPLLALAHHNLAIALLHQGSDEAEHHASTALALRADPQSHLAEQDRILLARLREAKAALN
jgi:tetratricopeptide (TPR) repeat protein